MSTSVCVVGSFMMDLVARAPRRPVTGETLVGTGFDIFLGGKGFNQAVAAARADASTSFVGRLGDDDFGRQFRAAMHREGIDADAVLSDQQHGTGVGLPIVEPSGQNSIIIVPRANHAVTVEQVEAAAPTIQAAAVLLLQLEIPVPAVATAARLARQAGTTVVLNPAPFAPCPPEVLEQVDVLVPNEVELLALSGGDVAAGIELLARQVHGEWATDLVVTLGARGALVLDGSGTASVVDGHTARAVDTVGAGDVFCGSLGARLAEGADLAEAVAYANAAAALAVTRPGGAESAPTRVEVMRTSTAPPM